MTAGFQSFQRLGVASHELEVWEIVLLFPHLLYAPNCEPRLGRGFPCAIQQVADHLVAVGRDPRTLKLGCTNRVLVKL